MIPLIHTLITVIVGVLLCRTIASAAFSLTDKGEPQ